MIVGIEYVFCGGLKTAATCCVECGKVKTNCKSTIFLEYGEKNVILYLLLNYISIDMRLTYSFLLVFFCFSIMSIPCLAEAQETNSDATIKNDFKLTLLSLGSGSSRFTYERAFSPLNSAEFTVGIIGMGWDWMNNSDPRGLLTKLAYKWRLLPQKSSDSWLAGFYVKPELIWVYFGYNKKDVQPNDDERDVSHMAALLAECGYQMLLRWFVFDIYTGLGPAIGSTNENNYYHGFMLFPEDGWLAFTAGFRLGIAF